MDKPNSEFSSSAESFQKDGVFEQELQRLHQLTVCGRWVFVGILWLVVGLPSLWGLRSEIELWVEYFTWAAVRYTIAYNRLLSIGVVLCIGMTVAVLIWQSRNILFGLPQQERHHLEKQVLQIRQQGESHPLWRWVIEGHWN